MCKSVFYSKSDFLAWDESAKNNKKLYHWVCRKLRLKYVIEKQTNVWYKKVSLSLSKNCHWICRTWNWKTCHWLCRKLCHWVCRNMFDWNWKLKYKQMFAFSLYVITSTFVRVFGGGGVWTGACVIFIFNI